MTTRTLLFLTFLLLISTTQALAQITITESDLRAQLFKSVTISSFEASTLTGLQDLAQQTGGNLTFDITTATFVPSGATHSRLYDCATSTLPACSDPDFATANLVISADTQGGAGTDSVAFALLDATGFYVLGAAARGDFDENNPGDEDVTFKFTPAALFQKLPTTMGVTWDNNTTLTTSLFTEFQFEFREKHTVDGWGRLVTPFGEDEALQVRSATVIILHFQGNTIVRDTTHTIDYLTRSGLTASIYMDSEGTVISADYSIPNNLILANDRGNGVPSQISVGQNFPNPFSQSTTIPVTMRQAGTMSLTIYDLLGREVTRLVNETRPAGSYDVTWEAGDLPNGIYVCKLSVGGESLTRMLTLIR